MTEFLQDVKAKGQTIEEWAHNCGFDSYAEDLRCHLKNIAGIRVPCGGYDILNKPSTEDVEGIVRLALISLRSNLQDR